MYHHSRKQDPRQDKMNYILYILVLILVCGTSSSKPRFSRFQRKAGRPLIIGHRGASGVLPENTAEAHEQAFQDGADLIECDICLTKDLRIVCIHESWLSPTTDVADVFDEDRMNTYFVHDQARFITDYFTVDFTLEEIKQLGVNQRESYRDPNYDGQFEIPTLEEVLDVVLAAHPQAGVLVEVKDPTWVNTLDIVSQANKTFEDIMLEVLAEKGCEGPQDHCIIQSFNDDSLQYLRYHTDIPLAVLLGSAADTSDEALEAYAEYCFSVNPTKRLIVQTFQNVITGRTDLVERIHAHGMDCHVWTFRNEDRHLAWDYAQDAYLEYMDFLDQDVDGYITDFPASANRFLNTAYVDEE